MDLRTRVGYLDSWDVEEIVSQGNAAIRAADSALDMGLQLINHVLALGIHKRGVRWTAEPQPGSLHEKISALQDPKAPDLLVALKKAYNSMGVRWVGLVWGLADAPRGASHRDDPGHVRSRPVAA